jgi:endonuclease/exonuclease/phosphatase family metal-dependent hydrolase
MMSCFRSAVFLAIAIACVGCDPFHTQFTDEEPAERYRATKLSSERSPHDTLRVMNWNAKFGGGRIDFFFDCHGDRSLMTESEVETNLARLAEVIRKFNPDILLLQEVDTASKRAAYVDQVQRLLDLTELNHAVYASQWRADYVPSDGIGPVDSGNAILSRYPIGDATRFALPLIDDQDGLTQYFYLRRNFLDATIELPGGDIHVVNVHIAAYASGDVKTAQIGEFHDHLVELDQAGADWIAGGDLNTLPPGAEQRSDFPDSVCEDDEFIADDYGEEPEQIAYLWNSWSPAIPLERYLANESRYFTHTTDKDGFWNRKLDYLFTNGAFTGGDVLQSAERGGFETMSVSDHAPLVVDWGGR